MTFRENLRNPCVPSLLLMALAVRLYGISSPLTDGGHERQTQVAMIARNFLRDGLNIFYPRLDTFGPESGYVTLEFPLQSFLMALLFSLSGVQDVIGRLITIVFSVGSVYFMYDVARSFVPKNAALFAASVYALSPLSIFFGRAVFPEALLMFFCLGAMSFLVRWFDTKRARFYWASAIFMALGCLVKAPPAGLFLLPLGAIWWTTYGTKTLQRSAFFVYFGIALLPVLAWARWANHLGPADPGWNPYQLSAIKRWGIPDSWFSADLYIWMTKSLFLVCLTPLVALLAVFGTVHCKQLARRAWVYVWLLSGVLFVFLTPGAQATHWNYQVPLIPIGALLAAIGLYSPLAKKFFRAIQDNRIWGGMVVSLVIVSYFVLYVTVLGNAYDSAKRVPNGVAVAGIVKREFASREGFLLLVQPNMVATTQSYLMDRKVKTLPEIHNSRIDISEIEKWRSRGAVGLVAVDTPYGLGTELIRTNAELFAHLKATCRSIAEEKSYLIFATR